MSTQTMNTSYLVATTRSVLCAAYPDVPYAVRATWKRSIRGMMGGLHEERMVRVDHPSGPPAAEVAEHLHHFVQRPGHRVEVRCGREAPVVVEYENVRRRDGAGDGARSGWDFGAASDSTHLRMAAERGNAASVENYRQRLEERGYQALVVDAPNGGPTLCWLLDPREWTIDVAVAILDAGVTC